MKVNLTHKLLLSWVTPAGIADHFFVQQGRYMRINNLATPPVKRKAVERYAEKCFKQLKKQMAKCKTKADWQKLSEAYDARTSVKVTKPEFIVHVKKVAK